MFSQVPQKEFLRAAQLNWVSSSQIKIPLSEIENENYSYFWHLAFFRLCMELIWYPAHCATLKKALFLAFLNVALLTKEKLNFTQKEHRINSNLSRRAHARAQGTRQTASENCWWGNWKHQKISLCLSLTFPASCWRCRRRKCKKDINFNFDSIFGVPFSPPKLELSIYVNKLKEKSFGVDILKFCQVFVLLLLNFIYPKRRRWREAIFVVENFHFNFQETVKITENPSNFIVKLLYGSRPKAKLNPQDQRQVSRQYLCANFEET